MREAVRKTAFVGGDAEAIVDSTLLVLRDVEIEADIGVLPHEIGRPQRLRLTVTLQLERVAADLLSDTVDYCEIVEQAVALGRERIGLVETFARKLAEHCIRQNGVILADVLVEKPAALQIGTAGARVTLATIIGGAGGPKLRQADDRSLIIPVCATEHQAIEAF